MNMLPTSVIESHFCTLPTEQLEILLELRNLVARASPNAEEVIHRYGLVYFDGARGGPVSAGICQILVKGDCLHLSFVHGAFLPDPLGLLQKEGSRLAKRFVPLYAFDQIHWQAVEGLIFASSKFDPYRYFQDHPLPR